MTGAVVRCGSGTLAQPIDSGVINIFPIACLESCTKHIHNRCWGGRHGRQLTRPWWHSVWQQLEAERAEEEEKQRQEREQNRKQTEREEQERWCVARAYWEQRKQQRDQQQNQQQGQRVQVEGREEEAGMAPPVLTPQTVQEVQMVVGTDDVDGADTGIGTGGAGSRRTGYRLLTPKFKLLAHTPEGQPPKKGKVKSKSKGGRRKSERLMENCSDSGDDDGDDSGDGEEAGRRWQEQWQKRQRGGDEWRKLR